MLGSGWSGHDRSWETGRGRRGKLTAALGWWLEWGAYDRADLEALDDGSDAVPVDPLPEWQWIWRAWHRLSAERPHVTQGFGIPMGGTVIEGRPGVIPWSAVRTWAEHHGLTWAEMALLDRVLLAMDGVYIKHWTEKFKARVS